MARKKKTEERREKNNGSVFQTANGKWRAMADLGRDENGRRIRKQVYYGDSEQEANDAVKKASEQKAHLKQEAFTNTFVDKMRYWLLHEKQPTVKSRSFENSMINFKNHIEKQLNGLSISEVDITVLKKLLKSIKHDEPRRKTKYLLNQFLNYAVEEKLVLYNPVMSIDITTKESEDVLEKEKHIKYKGIKPEHRVQFFEALSKNPFLNYLCQVAYFSGLRIGELLGLRWQDVDLSKKILSVEHAITTESEFDEQGNRISKKTILSEPKTKSSKAKLPMSEIFVELLKQWKEIQDEKTTKTNIQYTKPTNFIFCNEDGEMRTYYGTKTILERFKRNNHLEDCNIHFHAIRHTFGTILRENNWSLYDIQKMLRHSKASTTEIYLSMEENPALKLKDEIANVFDEEAFVPKRKSKDFEM
ncbi:MAG: site-specific integrase [Anaeroplasma bactoclasticum]|nr:site-specific integrase [Anaeroplasma bactoclasticum]